MTATDKDEGPNAEATYSIDPTSLDFSFSSFWAVSNSGAWTPIQALDYDSGKRHFEFLVIANGLLDPAKSDVTNLQIDVINCNDEAPSYVTGESEEIL